MAKRESKKKYPKVVDIGGQPFSIKIYKKVPKDIQEELGAVAGWCDWDNKILGLKQCHADRDYLTLFHEIGHAAADATKADNPIGNETFARPFFAIFFAALKSAGLIKD